MTHSYDNEDRTDHRTLRRALRSGLCAAAVLAATSTGTFAGAVTTPRVATGATVNIGDATLYEGNSGLQVVKLNVTLSDPQAADVYVSYTTTDGTATSPNDYTARHGRVRIRPGRTASAISIKILGDTSYEPDEQFTVVLTDAGPVGLADATGSVSISNDDPAPVPDPPTAPLNLRLIGANAVVWDAPTSALPITFYEVQESTDAGATWAHAAQRTTLSYPQSCTGCRVRVAAFSSAGFGPWAELDVPLFAAPSQPLNLAAVQDVTDPNFIDVAWDPPTFASPAITGYTVIADGVTWETTTALTSRPRVRLAGTRTIVIQVIAVNPAGTNQAAITLLVN